MTKTKSKKYYGGKDSLPYREILQCVGLLISIVFLGITLNGYSKDESVKLENIYSSSFMLIIPLIAIFIFAGSFLNDEYNRNILLGVIIFSGIALFLNYLSSYIKTPVGSTYMIFFRIMINILTLLILLIGLAIFYKMFSNNLLRVGGVSKFVILLIFYIPCLISDMVQFVKEQLHITPNIVHVLLIFETVLVVAYFVLPRYFRKPSINGGIELHRGKLFLDRQTVLTLADPTLINILDLETNDVNMNDRSRKGYSLSMWLYINPPEMSDNTFPIFCYGNPYKSGKPLITYGYDKEVNTFLLTIVFSNSSGINESIKIVIPHQKWNNLVFNYNGSNSDLFLNGILERSVNLSNSMPEFSVSDLIKVGSDDKGLNGVISDVVYFKQPLSALEILGSYRLGINTINL
jgi:hypothetical protein